MRNAETPDPYRVSYRFDLKGGLVRVPSIRWGEVSSLVTVNPFSGGDYFPVYDDERGECYLDGWFGDVPCAGSVELRPTPSGVIPCCERHNEML